MNLKYMKVSLFEITYKKKITFSRHSNLLRCTCIHFIQIKWWLFIYMYIIKKYKYFKIINPKLDLQTELLYFKKCWLINDNTGKQGKYWNDETHFFFFFFFLLFFWQFTKLPTYCSLIRSKAFTNLPCFDPADVLWPSAKEKAKSVELREDLFWRALCIVTICFSDDLMMI